MVVALLGLMSLVRQRRPFGPRWLPFLAQRDEDCGNRRGDDFLLKPLRDAAIFLDRADVEEPSWQSAVRHHPARAATSEMPPIC
jgi:hypothetical protein